MLPREDKDNKQTGEIRIIDGRPGLAIIQKIPRRLMCKTNELALSFLLLVVMYIGYNIRGKRYKGWMIGVLLSPK